MTNSQPPNKLRSGLILANASILITFLMLEILVRLFLPVSDVLYGISDAERGYHREPNQRGRYVLGMGEVYGRYSINAQGWNASRDYTPESTADLRVAVIGDSFIEALQVDVNEAFPDLMEATLDGGQCGSVEVYRFGIAGAPLSHYWAIMQHVAETYHPDLFIINIITNDFDQSLKGGEFFGPYFWRFERSDDEFTPIPPEARQVEFRDRLLDSIALRRFLNTNMQMDARLRAGLQLPPETALTEGRVANDDISLLTSYLFDEYQRIAADSALLLTMEADRASIYGDPHDPQQQAYEALVSGLAREKQIDYLNLRTILAADYARNHQPFEFTLDAHWNEHGHTVVANALTTWVEDNLCP